MGIEQIQDEMERALSHEGLVTFLVDRPRITDLGDELFAEIVVSDEAKKNRAGQLAKEILDRTAQGRKVTLLVRSKWDIAQIGDLSPAYGPDGGLRAAILLPVTLKSGAETTHVTVSVTKMAEWELDRILGQTSDLKTRLKQVAELVVEGKLRRGGRSFWDPVADNYLEVTSSSVGNLSRLLRKTA